MAKSERSDTVSTHHDWWRYIKAIIRRYPARKGKTMTDIMACEQEAVRRAVEATERMKNGKDRLLVIDLVFWKKSHTLAGAALQVPCSEATAQRYHAAFIREVAKHFKCDGLLES